MFISTLPGAPIQRNRRHSGARAVFWQGKTAVPMMEATKPYACVAPSTPATHISSREPIGTVLHRFGPSTCPLRVPMVHIDQQVYPPYIIGLTSQKVGRNRKRPRLTLHLDFPKGEHMDTPKHFKHAPCTLKFPHISAFWTFVKLAQISTFSPIERFRIALQCVQPRALQAPINTRPPRKFAPQNTSTAQGVLVLRVVLTACTTMNVCSPKVLATVRVSPTQL